MRGKFRKTSQWVILVWTVSVTSFGCGPAQALKKGQSAQKKVTEETVHPARKFGLKVLREAQDTVGTRQFRRPEAVANLESRLEFDEGLVANGHQISFRKLLPVAGPQRLFFVWPDQLLDSTITLAMVSLRALDGNNRWVGVSQPTIAEHDPVLGRWYVSIQSLLPNSEGNRPVTVSAVETHVMKLDLFLSNQKRVVLDVRFRVSALIPRER